MFLKQLHDQGPALIQSSAQRRVGDPVQISEEILSFCTWLNEVTFVQASHTFLSSSAAVTPDVARLTCSIEGEDVSLTLGGALGGVGLRAAAGETTSLPPRGARVVTCQLQLWIHDEER